MKSKTEYLTFNTKIKRAFVNITPDVRKIAQDSNIKEGLYVVNATYITTSIFINDNESGLHGDFDIWLEKLAPHSPTEQYRHNETGEDNADTHLKRQIMGREVVVAVTNGKLDVGSWEQIFYGKFDGQRNKSTCEGNRRVNNKNPGYILSPCKKWLQLNANSRIAFFTLSASNNNNDASLSRPIVTFFGFVKRLAGACYLSQSSYHIES